jgi:hypothetical protein
MPPAKPGHSVRWLRRADAQRLHVAYIEFDSDVPDPEQQPKPPPQYQPPLQTQPQPRTYPRRRSVRGKTGYAQGR